MNRNPHGHLFTVQCLVCDFADYLEKLHRRGNKVILVHSVELPELSLHNASKYCLCVDFDVACIEALLIRDVNESQLR